MSIGIGAGEQMPLSLSRQEAGAKSSGWQTTPLRSSSPASSERPVSVQGVVWGQRVKSRRLWRLGKGQGQATKGEWRGSISGLARGVTNGRRYSRQTAHLPFALLLTRVHSFNLLLAIFKPPRFSLTPTSSLIFHTNRARAPLILSRTHPTLSTPPSISRAVAFLQLCPFCAIFTTMKASILSAVALAAAAMANPVVARDDTKTPSVSVKGNAFYKADGSRFYIRGVDFQPGGSSGGEGSDGVQDPLAKLDNCRKNIKYFQQLGINTVRVYTVDNSANHDECMKELSDAGIYLALDVNSPKYSLNSANVKPSYNEVYLQNIFATIDQFSKYDNTLLFFGGNEVINAPNTTVTAPYIKAVIRDMKNYIKARNYRSIPVGYSAADVEETRYQTAAFLNCGNDASARTDFFAFNDYSYCNSDFVTSGWAAKVKQYANYSVPLFLSEYGCVAHTPRTFPEVKDLYSTKMTGSYSGGLVYQWTKDGGDPKYGLVDDSGSDIKTLTDYDNLMKQFKSTPAPTGDGGATTSNKISQCPSQSDDFDFDASKGLPIMPVKAQQYMQKGAGTGAGLSGQGSQWEGTPSTGFSTAAGTSSSSGSSTSSGSGSSTTASGSAAPHQLSPVGYLPLAVSLVVVASTFFGASLM